MKKFRPLLFTFFILVLLYSLVPSAITAKTMDPSTPAPIAISAVIDSGMLLPGKPSIDPGMLIPGNAYIDPGMLISPDELK